MKDVEIGTQGEVKVYMKLDELFRIANKEAKDFADQVCRDNSRLQYELDLARLALAQIHEVIDEVYDWDNSWAVDELECKHVDEIAKILKEYEE